MFELYNRTVFFITVWTEIRCLMYGYGQIENNPPLQAVVRHKLRQ